MEIWFGLGSPAGACWMPCCLGFEHAPPVLPPMQVLVEILDDLKLGTYEVKLNHRRLLDAMLDIAGVPPQRFRPICSAIDKLDKEPWEVVRAGELAMLSWQS